MEGWHPRLINLTLAGRYSAKMIDRTAQELLGFPAVMVTGGREVAAVEAELTKRR